VRASHLAAPMLAAALCASGCAARGFAPPTGPGQVDTTLGDAFSASMARCTGLRSIAAEVALSGRVDGRKVRGRLQIGLTRDGGVRVEAVAPFGAPMFTIAGRPDGGVLWLPRSKETVRATPAELLDSLTGLSLSPSGLFEILTACPAEDDAVVKTERFASPDLARATYRLGTMIWWRPGTAPVRPLAAQREGATVEYGAFAGDRPQSLKLRAAPGTGGTPRADLTLAVSQVETNVALGPEAFTLDVPVGAHVLTLAELRQAGVLR
jgi:hypothetical protein